MKSPPAIQLESGHALDAVDVIRHCEGQMAYFAVPRFVRIVTAMPLTENGKIRKAALREAGRTSDTWDREAAGYKLRARAAVRHRRAGRRGPA